MLKILCWDLVGLGGGGGVCYNKFFGVVFGGFGGGAAEGEFVG